jgi:NAD(P)-dependent dehydrogenase (short-subunit alcohol dehydrogenase family)
VDGFELQFGVNFLGHFALTGYLYPLLKAAPGARIVTVSSGAHKWVDGIDYENLRAEKPYDERREYGTSKLANLLFVLELQRRISRAGDQILSLGAHPGITRTELSRHLENAEQSLAQYANIMEPWQGALSTLYAATAPGVAGGQYFGPDGDNELTGYPATAKISKAALDESAGTRLWEYAERLTSVEYP